LVLNGPNGNWREQADARFQRRKFSNQALAISQKSRRIPGGNGVYRDESDIGP